MNRGCDIEELFFLLFLHVNRRVAPDPGWAHRNAGATALYGSQDLLTVLLLATSQCALPREG